MKNDMYLKQASLILRVLPHIYKEECFALKGGTAINFFIRDFPRLSVDIDLALINISERNSSLNEINSALLRISNSLRSSYSNIEITQRKLKEADSIIGLSLRNLNVSINIEVNIVFRGSVFITQIAPITKRIKSDFEIDQEMRLLSTADIYGGKICAALDRQHPRDLFDIKLLFDNEGITDDIRKAFIIYLISHPRPISELLNPNLHDIKMTYENEFAGMTDDEVSYDQLLQARERLVSTIQKDLTENEKEFLISFKNKTPYWKLLDLYHDEDPVFNIERIKSLPAIKWKLFNLEKMTKKKHLEAVSILEQFLRKQ